MRNCKLGHDWRRVRSLRQHDAIDFTVGKFVQTRRDCRQLQGSRIRSVRILFSERYVRTLTYSILAYVNKNRIRTQTIIAQTANWFFATFVINLLSDSVVLNCQFNYISWRDFLSSCHGPIKLHWSKRVTAPFR